MGECCENSNPDPDGGVSSAQDFSSDSNILVCVFEQYENQALMFGKWGTSGLVGRHKFSDVTGKIKLKREYFLPPKGWEWEGDWFIDPERRSGFCLDYSTIEQK